MCWKLHEKVKSVAPRRCWKLLEKIKGVLNMTETYGLLVFTIKNHAVDTFFWVSERKRAGAAFVGWLGGCFESPESCYNVLMWLQCCQQ